MSGHAMKSGALVDAWRFADRSYKLEPESPVVIQILANAWEGMGAIDEAERLLLKGLEIAGENFSLRSNYFFLLLRQGRLEKAERLVQEQYGDSVEHLPEQLQHYYYFQKGMISLMKGDRNSARQLIERTLNEDSSQAWDGEQVLVVTLSSALQRDAGNVEIAEQRLAHAERAVRRARINGVDDASIYYTETSIHALKGETQAALDALQLAYERGFRDIWMLDIDLRLESIHDEPQFIAIRQQIERDLEKARSEVTSFAVAALSPRVSGKSRSGAWVCATI